MSFKFLKIEIDNFRTIVDKKKKEINVQKIVHSHNKYYIGVSLENNVIANDQSGLFASRFSQVLAIRRRRV